MHRVPAGPKPALRRHFPPTLGNFSVALFRNVFTVFCMLTTALRGCLVLGEENKSVAVTTCSSPYLFLESGGTSSAAHIQTCATTYLQTHTLEFKDRHSEFLSSSSTVR